MYHISVTQRRRSVWGRKVSLSHPSELSGPQLWPCAVRQQRTNYDWMFMIAYRENMFPLHQVKSPGRSRTGCVTPGVPSPHDALRPLASSAPAHRTRTVHSYRSTETTMALIPESDMNNSTTEKLFSIHCKETWHMIQHQVSVSSFQHPSIKMVPCWFVWINGVAYTPVFICEFLAYLVLFQAETSGVPRSSVWITEVKVRARTCKRGYQKLQLQRKQLKDRYIL